MSIALDALAAHTLSVMRSVSSRRKIRRRCAHSSVLSDEGSCGNGRKDSTTIRLRRRAMSRAGERDSISERSSRGYLEILPVEAARPRTARSGGVSGRLHRTTVRGADHIGGIVRRKKLGQILTPKAFASVIRESLNSKSLRERVVTSGEKQWRKSSAGRRSESRFVRRLVPFP